MTTVETLKLIYKLNTNGYFKSAKSTLKTNIINIQDLFLPK